MRTLEEKMSYIQGLAEGLQISSSSSEGRVLQEVVHVLANMSREVDELKGSQEALEIYVESLEDDFIELTESLDLEEWDWDVEAYDDDETGYYGEGEELPATLS